MIIKNSAMNPIRIAIKVLVGGLSLGVFSQVLADTSLYGLNGGGSITNTGATPTNAGFTFSIQPGFQATFSKLGFWVNQAADPARYRATVSLYDLTSQGSTLPPPPQAQLIEQAVGNNIESGCSLEASFCYANVANSVTLVSGRTYLLTSSYGTFLNDNTYYLSGLTTPTNVSFASNIIYGNSYFDPSTTVAPGSNYGVFGPNLGGLQVTAVPSGAPVPAPLPIIGATAALAYSRKIRSRIKSMPSNV